MNYFPNNEEEIEMLKFIAKYQYLNTNDIQYFFQSQKYYRKRVTSLISKKFLRRIKLNLVLDELGMEYMRMLGFEYNNLNRDKRYLPRLLYLSNLGAYYHNCKTVEFTPSFLIKNKETYTTTARRFIGVLNIKGIEYLTYRISKEQDSKYLASVIYDIQKEKNYKNIIVFIDDISRININDFSFGNNQVLIVEDNEENREKLKYMHSINWFRVIKDHYGNKVFFAEYNFCDYTNHRDKFISIFYFFDTEKINRIKYFLRENKNKNADIICSSTLEQIIKKELPNANYRIVNLDEYIDKEQIVYD